MIPDKSRVETVGKRSIPFICSNIPFINSGIPKNMPTVGINKPFILSRNKSNGFTLIELMVSFVVVAVLVMVAVPGFQTFIKNGRITTNSNDLLGELATARSEAIKRNNTVVICRSANPTAATPACAGGAAGTWETGWILFEDGAAAKNNTFSTGDAGDVLIRIHEPLTGNLTLRSNGASLADSIAFTREGLTTLPVVAAGATPNHFKLCDSRGQEHARAIVLESTGRARIDRLSTFAALTCP